MAQILGSNQNVLLGIGGGTQKTLVCLRTSSVNTTMDATTEQTNCGVLTSPSEPQMTLDFDAICETAPSVTQISYTDLLSASVNKTTVTVVVEDPIDGTIYYHGFTGYITDLTLNQATTEFVNFSGTIQSTGPLTV